MYQRRYLEVRNDSLKVPVAIVGLPGIANVGKIAVETLIQILDAALVGDYFSKEFPPRVLVQNGIGMIPKSSMYLYRAAPDEPHDLLILTADYQPSTSTGVYEYADFIASQLDELGVKELYALAAYEQTYEDYFEYYPDSPRIYLSASSEETLARLSVLSNISIIKDGSIVGANGVVPSWASTLYNMHSACILGETLGVIKADYRAAKAVLQKITDILGICVDLDGMDSEITKVVQLIEWTREEITKKRESSDDDRSPSDLYIG